MFLVKNYRRITRNTSQKEKWAMSWSNLQLAWYDRIQICWILWIYQLFRHKFPHFTLARCIRFSNHFKEVNSSHSFSCLSTSLSCWGSVSSPIWWASLLRINSIKIQILAYQGKSCHTFECFQFTGDLCLQIISHLLQLHFLESENSFLLLQD